MELRELDFIAFSSDNALSHRRSLHDVVINDLLNHTVPFQKKKPNNDGKNDNSKKIVKRGSIRLLGRSLCVLFIVKDISQKIASTVINCVLNGTGEYSVPSHPRHHPL